MFAKRFGEWVVRHRWWILVLTPLVVAGAASGARFLTFSTDYRMFFSKHNPQLAAFEQLQDTYTKNDNVLIALTPKSGDVFTRETLAAVKELTEQGWQVPYSLRVDSLTNYQHTSASGDDLVVEDLVPDPAALGDAELEAKRAIALSEPLLVNRLVSPDSKVTGVNITVHLPGRDPVSEVPEVAAYARAMVDEARARHPDIAFHLSGMVMMNNAFPEATQGDMKTLVPLMYGVIILIMIGLLRSVTGTVGTVLVMAMSVLTGMGLFGWAGGSLTGPSASAPTIILTLAVADSIHILVTMAYEMRHGRAKHAAIAESLRINLQPVFLTSLTTAIGFLSMNFSDVPPFRHLGNIVAVGVVAAFCYSVLFLPAFVAVLPVRVRPAREGRRLFMDHLGDFVVRRRRALFWGMLAVIAVLLSGLPRIEFNDQFVNYFDERYAFRTDTDYISRNLTGIYLMEYSLESGRPGGIADPEYLRTLAAFADWLRAQPEVLYVNPLSDTLKRLNRNLHGDDPAWYRIPERRDLAAQYLLLYELSLPYGLDLNNQINVKKSATRLTAVLQNLTTRQTLDLEERAKAWLHANAPEPMWAEAASPTIMFTHISFRNIRSMLAGTATALVLISGILIVAVRSLRIGLISLIPNLVPTAMAFGLWGLLVGQVGLATSVVASISLGIVVDDTIHFLSKYLRARREHGYDAPQAVRYAFHTVGTALWVTSVILVGGFLVLTLSGFELNAQMGLLTGIALVFALTADFLFLPPLLMTIDRDRNP